MRFLLYSAWEVNDIAVAAKLLLFSEGANEFINRFGFLAHDTESLFINVLDSPGILRIFFYV